MPMMLPACILYFFSEQLGDRDVAAFRQAELLRERRELVLGVLGREPHRVAHVEQRARAERRHVVGRHVGVGMHDAHRLGRDVEHLGDDLRVGGVGALPHVDGAAIERAAAVGRDVDDRDRGGRRDRGLEADGDAAPALHRAGAAIERPRSSSCAARAGRAPPRWRRPASCVPVACGAAVAQDVLAPELDRVELRARAPSCRCGSRRPTRAAGCRSRAARRPAAGWCRASTNRCARSRCRRARAR